MDNVIANTLTARNAVPMNPHTNGHSAPQTPPNPEVLARPTRRCFSAEYKRHIVAQAARCSEPGAIGALLRREGLYSSQLADWRRQERLAEAGNQGVRHPRADVLASENRTLKRQNASLQRRLAQAEAVIELQKKVSELLGITLSAPESDGSE